MKRLRCGDLVPGCPYVAQEDTDAAVLHIEMDHARESHGIEVTSGFLERARERIREAEPRAAGEVSSREARRG
jgi:predicted small metal-binding protein